MFYLEQIESIIKMSVHRTSRKFCVFISLLTVFSTFSVNFAFVSNPFMKQNFNGVKKAISEQTELWNNVDKIDDGGVYFIKSASNNNLVWDIPSILMELIFLEPLI